MDNTLELSEKVSQLASSWPFQQRQIVYITAKVKDPATPQPVRNAVFAGQAAQLAVSMAITTDDSVRSTMIEADPWTVDAANELVTDVILQTSINAVWPILESVWNPQPPAMR